MGYRGPRKHLKRLNTPKGWLLDKLSGVWAPRPSPGPHKLRQCIPLILVLRNRLKYALTGREVQLIVMNRKVNIDSKCRTDKNYPCGFMDVLSVPDTEENFRILYDTKGRFSCSPINEKEAGYKLCKVVKKFLGPKGIPYIVTHDGRTMSYPDPDISINDTVRWDFEQSAITGFIKFTQGKKCMVTGGRNRGRIGDITHIEKHPGSFDIIHIKDVRGSTYLTRKTNVFIIGDEKLWIQPPRGGGVRRTILEERDQRQKRKKQL